MKKVRTTLKIEENLKTQAELKAVKERITLQDIFNNALRSYLREQTKKDVKKLVFHDKAIDKNMGNLSRNEIYDWD